MIMRFTKINSTVCAISIYWFIYLFMLWCQCFNCWQSFKKCTREWNSVVIKDCERDIQVWKNVKVYFKWGWNKSPFDIISVVFHFDDFNYGRRSQPYKLLLSESAVSCLLHVRSVPFTSVLQLFIIAVWCPFHIKSVFS
jgi:hypothetical protein